MKYRRQYELEARLDKRIPRGPRGSLQNRFRGLVSFYASQPRYTFEDGLGLALASIRESDPNFDPLIRPDS